MPNSNIEDVFMRNRGRKGKSQHVFNKKLLLPNKYSYDTMTWRKNKILI